MLVTLLLWSTTAFAALAGDECAGEECFEHMLDMPKDQAVLQPTATTPEPIIYANSTVTNAVATPTYTVPCAAGSFPNVCENWCYYVFCHKTGTDRNSAFWGVTVNRTAGQRGKSECGRISPNKCSTKTGAWPPNPTPSQDCDEQPKNTNDEGGANAATRCMGRDENRGEGSAWSTFINYGSSGRITDGTKIWVELQNPAGPICASYRTARTTVCPPPAQSNSTTAATDGIRQQ